MQTKYNLISAHFLKRKDTHCYHARCADRTNIAQRP